MPKQKTIAELNAEKEKVERQLAQEQHKIQRLENRAAYYEKGNRRKRAHQGISGRTTKSWRTAPDIRPSTGSFTSDAKRPLNGSLPTPGKNMRCVIRNTEVWLR